MRGLLTLAMIGAFAAPSSADTLAMIDQAWPRVEPRLDARSLSDEVTDRMTEMGNELGHHMNVLTGDLVSLQFDGRARRAKFRVGGGDDRYLTFAIASDIHFTASEARIKTRIDVGFQGRRVRLELPEFEMMPQSYQGDRVVVLLVPFLERRW